MAQKVKIIKFHKKLYPLNSIKEAARAYANLGRFKISNSKDYLEVIVEYDYGSFGNNFIDEFGNYALGVSAKCSLIARK